MGTDVWCIMCIDKNNVYYYDYNHLSSHGSKLLSDQIIKKIKKIFE